MKKIKKTKDENGPIIGVGETVVLGIAAIGGLIMLFQYFG